MQLAIRLDQKSSLPIYRQLADAMKEAILSGRLQPGQALPSTRELCESLNVSRITVRKSYDALISQGFATASTGSGTFVAKTLPTKAAAQRRPTQSERAAVLPVLSEYGRRLVQTVEKIPLNQEQNPELNFGIPVSEHLPLAVWRKLLLKPLPPKKLAALKYTGDPRGYFPLREALAGYLSRSRAVQCEPDRIVLTSGTSLVLDLLCRLLLEPGDHVAVENPGYPGARRLFLLHGATVHAIPVDEHGLKVSELAALPKPPRLVYVTPSHQDPTGVVLSVQRRKELLVWAARHGSFIIEDDHDSEFRYEGAPVPSLQALDVDDLVIYVSTFWRTLGPLVVLGLVVLPHRLMDVFINAKATIERDLALLEQYALADFVEEGHLERHIRKTRALYAKRRHALAHALTVHLGKSVKLSPESAGMHIAVNFSNTISDSSIMECAAESGLMLVSTKPYYVDNAVSHQFLIPFAHTSETELASRVERFAKLLKKR
jgi:GntR family transcriptional regulator/MocR family aminotransferase